MNDIELSNINYDNYIDRMKAKMGSFLMDAESGVSNKSSALRARQLSLALRNDLKDFRELSIFHDKQQKKVKNHKSK